MIDEIANRVAASRRYRDVATALVRRLAGEEAIRARSVDDAVKRVKRRLHQAVGAFERRRGDGLGAIRAAWSGDLSDPTFRAACRAAMAAHASAAERAPGLEAIGALVADLRPRSVVDLGCGIGPLALPWYGLARDARYLAVDVDGGALATVGAFLELVAQPHEVREQDLVADPRTPTADLALLLKLVTTLDRQDQAAAERLIRGLRVERAIVSFPARSLGGRGGVMATTYRRRMDELLTAVGPRLTAVEEASVPDELTYVLALAPADG